MSTTAQQIASVLIAYQASQLAKGEAVTIHGMAETIDREFGVGSARQSLELTRKIENQESDELMWVRDVVQYYESLMRRFGDVEFQLWECPHGVPFTAPCEDCGAGAILPILDGYEVPGPRPARMEGNG